MFMTTSHANYHSLHEGTQRGSWKNLKIKLQSRNNQKFKYKITTQKNWDLQYLQIQIFVNVLSPKTLIQFSPIRKGNVRSTKVNPMLPDEIYFVASQVLLLIKSMNQNNAKLIIELSREKKGHPVPCPNDNPNPYYSETSKYPQRFAVYF